MAMKGQFEKLKFDEFSLIILGAIIFLGIMAISFTTPSEFPPKVSPLTVSLNLDPGSSERFNINVSGKVSGVNISTSGEVGGWLAPGRTDLGALQKTETVPVTISVPSTASAGLHTGKITVFGKEGKVEVDVSVVVSAMKSLTSRTVPLGDFKVSYVSGTRTLDMRNKTFVSRSYLYEKPISMLGLVTDEELPILQFGRVKMVVDDTNGYGPIIVTQNGREIFKEAVGPGLLVAPLNLTEIRNTNTIRISADYPGPFFWTENIYDLRDVLVDITYKGSVPKSFNFTLEPEEYKRFDHVQVSFRVKDSSAKLPPLKIALNGKTIFFGTPPTTTFNKDFSRDTFGSVIDMGAKNTLTFSFDQDASYEIADATLVVFRRS